MLSKTQILILVIVFGLSYIIFTNLAINWYMNTQYQQFGIPTYTVLGIFTVPDINSVMATTATLSIQDINDMASNALVVTLINTIMSIVIIGIVAWIIVSSAPTVNGGA